MTKKIAPSPEELQRVKALLNMTVPAYRQAYSVRTAWVMACLSDLAYIKFDSPVIAGEQKAYFIKNLSKLVEKYIDKEKLSVLIEMIDKVGYDYKKKLEELTAELGDLDMELMMTFDKQGTQAILVKNERFLVLAFRGTETTSMRDIRTDADAKKIICNSGGRVHNGFSDAFDLVAGEIQKELQKDVYKNIPLFVTGHSLGGALATIAAKRLEHSGGIAGCYTFGSPRVGNLDWLATMKTPVYRLVNSADCVTMLPPGEIPAMIISFLLRFIPRFGEKISTWFHKNYGGYMHCGNMRYLTDCKKNEYADVKLAYSVNFFYRLKGFAVGIMPWSKLIADHKIAVYRKKLEVIARQRNKLNQAQLPAS